MHITFVGLYNFHNRILFFNLINLKKIKVLKINIDENQQIAAQLRIQSIPTVIAFNKKKFNEKKQYNKSCRLFFAN